ncbi:DUF202 domain-containing protein [Sphingomonas gilva]|uniref:DUF202 domain-containing protein n=1 Tax=Sphingomonas gilva TaxID=2305907 RepID=A0A396RUS9_9SPHN|nr:DUF202 domain-containing protein [Sphingomonas gilva]RHW19152.1 DUF202 domain-containing protein [Sphingomonas gilva]
MPAEDRTHLAEDRTAFAEDRTALANERTFAGWMRTGLAAVAVGIGFHALFRSIEPLWVPKALATVFVLVGIFIFWAAERRACAVMERLDTHQVRTAANRSLRIIAVALSLGALGLIAGLWLLV